jgi:choline dehydrogenase
LNQAGSVDIPASRASDPDYIVVGSGPGGGPLASNLAQKGYSVLLLEAGLDDMYQSPDYQVPLLTAAAAPEDPRLEWEYFVRHYSDLAQQEKDDKMQFATDGTPLGIFYPRAGTLGGCGSHHFLLAVKPHDSDWDHIAGVTMDSSWSSENMTKYWQQLERNQYGSFMVTGPGHGYNGWLGTQVFDPAYILKQDPLIVRNLLAAALQFRSHWSKASLMAALNGDFTAFLNAEPHKPGLLTRDLNSGDPGRDDREGLFSVPFSISGNARSGPREFIAQTVGMGYPLTVKTGALATRVLFERGHHRGHRPLTAVAVQYLDGTHLYKADPNAAPPGPSVLLKTVRAKKEIILAGGTFNTPQLLKLSGVGPTAELKNFGIPVLLDVPGVGMNMQDRYEVGLVCVTNTNYSIFNNCTFGTTPTDPCLAAWYAGQEGAYNTAGTMGVVVKRSSTAERDPDLFMYAAPYNFTGYYRGYTQNIAPDYPNLRHFTWGVLKGHTRNTEGTVTLKSSNPLEPPQIDFRYFYEGTRAGGAATKDLEAMADGVEFVRTVIEKTNQLMSLNGGTFTEILPGANNVRTRDQIKQFIRDEAWGHHASGTAKIGADDDEMAVLDSRFRVRGTRGLRVVDASAFPRIPGFFIVVPIYMLSEKAAEVILEDAAS